MKKQLFISALVAFAAVSQAHVLVLDNMTNAVSFTSTGSSPRALSGMAFNLGNTAAGPVEITGMDFSYIYRGAVATTFTQIRFDVTFWDTAPGTISGTSAAFSNMVGNYAFTLSNVTRNPNTRYTFQNAVPGSAPGITFATPFSFSGVSNLGMQVLIRGDLGNGLVYSDDFMAALVTNHASGTWDVGSSASLSTANAGGFYRNASQPAATNASTSMLGSDHRTLTSNTSVGVAMRLYSADPVPEPATMSILGLAIATVAAKRKRK